MLTIKDVGIVVNNGETVKISVTKPGELEHYFFYVVESDGKSCINFDGIWNEKSRWVRRDYELPETE